MPIPSALPSSPAADPHAARAGARADARRALIRQVIGVVGIASAIVVVGAVVTGYLGVVGTGSCESDGDDEVCVRRAWWPFTIQQRAEHWTANGVPDGPRFEWHSNGEPWVSGAYEHGKRVGPWREFWSNGALRFAGTYVDDRLTGVEEWFFPDGTPEWSVERVAGVRVGLERWYWPNGELRREGRYDGGEKHGAFVLTNEAGRSMGTISYEHGVQVGRGAP